MNVLNESTVEIAALEYLRELGYSTEFGPELAPDTVRSERSAWNQVYLYERLREAIIRLNQGIDSVSVDEAVKRLERAESQNAVAENKRVHELIRDGVPVERRTTNGQLRTDRVRLIDFDHAANNEWLAVNQFTIIEGKNRSVRN